VYDEPKLIQMTATSRVEGATQQAEESFSNAGSGADTTAHERTQRLIPYHWKIYYETEIKLGSKKQPIHLLIDTGSHWTWIASDECRVNEGEACVDDTLFHY